MVQTNDYVSPCPLDPFSIGPGDVAGGLAWDLAATLAPSANVGFTIYKLAVPLPTPEPATLLLAACGLVFVVARKWSRPRSA